MDHRLYCGAARADITPSEEEIRGLFGLMRLRYAGIIDRLSARVIALRSGEDRALIVAFDLDKAPEPVTWLPELAAHTGIPEEQILYFGTHTHSAPLTTVRPRERNTVDPELRENMNRYEAVLHEKLLACADEALAALRPAKMGAAFGKSYVNVNRNADFVYTDAEGRRWPHINEGMNWGAEVDRTLLTVRFEDARTGAPIAILANYPMHCCLMFQNDYDGEGRMGISGDAAGRVSTALETLWPGAVAVWSSGAAGDVDPVLFNTLIYPDPLDGHVVRELIHDVRVTEGQLRMIAGWHTRDIAALLDTVRCEREEAVIRGAIEWSETPSSEDTPYRIRMQALRVGDVLLLGIGGELYNSFGRQLREASPAPYTAVINHNASLIDDAGYILDDDAIARARQEAPTAHFIPGGRTRSVPGTVGPSLLAKLGELSRRVDLES